MRQVTDVKAEPLPMTRAEKRGKIQPVSGAKPEAEVPEAPGMTRAQKRAAMAAAGPVIAPVPGLPFQPLVTVAVVALSGLLTISAFAGAPLVAVAVALAAGVNAWGWPGLLGLPSPRGTAFVLGVGSAAAIGTVLATRTEPFLKHMPAALAGAMIVAFLHQLARRDGRPRLGHHGALATVLGQLEARAERDRLGRARLGAVAAVDAAHEVDLVPLGISLPGRDRILRIVLGREDVDAPHRTRGGAQLAPDASLEPVVVPVQDVPPSMTRRHRLLLLRILNRDRLRAHLAERERQALQQLFDHDGVLCMPRPATRQPRR